MSLGGFTIPVTIDGLTLVAALLAILALALIASSIIDLTRRRRRRPLRFGSGIILLLLGLFALGLAGWTQTYRALTHNELVAYIRAVPIVGQRQTMSVTYTPVHNGQAGTSRTYILQGDQWLLGGDVIKWQDYMNILGIHTGYRITRLMGYYNAAHDANTRKVTAYDLDGGSDGIYLFVQQHPNLVPFVRAVYSNFTAAPPSNNATYSVYLSTSGYWTTKQ